MAYVSAVSHCIYTRRRPQPDGKATLYNLIMGDQVSTPVRT